MRDSPSILFIYLLQYRQRVFVPEGISEGESDGADIKKGAESRIVGEGELDISESGSIHVR